MKHGKKKRTTFSIIIPFLVIALVFGFLVWKKYRTSLLPHPVPSIHEPASTTSAVLFFVADGSILGREAREIEPCTEDMAECVKDVLNELFSGPVGELNDAVPEGTILNKVLIEGNMAVVDLNATFASEMPSGSSAEMMAVYSIVNTICVNFPQIAKVKFNIEGDEGQIALRHLDLSDPLAPDYTLEQKPALTSEKKSLTKKGQAKIQ